METHYKLTGNKLPKLPGLGKVLTEKQTPKTPKTYYKSTRSKLPKLPKKAEKIQTPNGGNGGTASLVRSGRVRRSLIFKVELGEFPPTPTREENQYSENIVHKIGAGKLPKPPKLPPPIGRWP